MDNDRRSFIKIMAGIAVAPLSFLGTATAAPSLADFKVVADQPEIVHVRCPTRKLKCRWTLELQKDLEAMELTRFPFSSIEDSKWKTS